MKQIIEKLSLLVLFLGILSPTPVFSYTWTLYNGHYYTLTSSQKSWANCEAEAQTAVVDSFGIGSGLVGHLVTINDAAENQWLYNNYILPDHADKYIGFNDAATEGHWVWSSGTGGYWDYSTGTGTSYVAWASGEPNNQSNEDVACIKWLGESPPSNTWGDYVGSTTRFGIIEAAPIPLPAPVIRITASRKS